MLQTLILCLFTAVAFLEAQTSTVTPITLQVLDEAARCDAIAATSLCFRYTKPAAPELPGVFEPGVARVRITGPDAAAVSVQATVLSPVGGQWLALRRVGELEGGSSISGSLPLDVEVFIGEAQLAGSRAGRFVAMLVVTAVGTSAPVKVPVQLAVIAETDAIVPEPDFVPELAVTANPNTQPLRFNIGVRRNQLDQDPLHVSVTPETNDGGNWLSADLRFGAAQCADQPLPCGFDAMVRPPQRPGDYWGVLVITGDGFADRVTVRVKVSPGVTLAPVTVEPRQVSMSAPFGSNYAVSTSVSLRGGKDGVSFKASYTEPWLAIEPAIGVWPATLRLIMSPYGLSPGVYTDTVVVRTLDTNEVLAAIPVRFNVIAPTYAPAMLDGGGWRTRLILVNPSTQEAKATLRFWSTSTSGNGETPSPWLLGLESRGLATKTEETIPAGGMRVVETQGAQSRTQQGWAELVSDGPVSMHAVLAESKTVSKWLPVEATVPMMNPFRDSLMLPFDNLGGGSVSISLANADDDEPATVLVTILNENGAEIAKEAKFRLAPREGGTYVLADKWPSTVQRRGLVALSYDGGRLFATGLRSAGKSFYSYPAVACAEMGVDRALPMVTAGGAWQSTAYLANTTPLGQLGLLRLWPDATRFAGQALSDESAPSVPPNGMTVWQAPCKDASRAGGGWLESRYTKQVNGFMLLRQSYSGTPAGGSAVESYESALAGQRVLAGRVAIPYDNRGSNTTRIVLVNPSDSPTDVQTVMYDLAGRYPRYADSFRLPAKGQLVVNSADRWELGTPQGILEFSSRQGVALTGVGLRFSDGPMAILPAYEK